MFSSFKNLFKSTQKTQNNENDTNNIDNKNILKNNEVINSEKDAENLRFKLSMEIYKLQNQIISNYDINLFNTDKMFEVFFANNLINWK